MSAARYGLASAILLVTLALAACQRAPAPPPTATSVPTDVPPPATSIIVPMASTTAEATATVAAPPSPEPTPASDQAPTSWQREATDQLSIALPPGWRAINLSGADAQSLYDGLKRNDPLLAGIIGGPEALAGAAFWAFAPEPSVPAESQFIDNLNIRGSPLGAQRISDIQQVIDVLLPEYEKMGLKVTSTDPTLRVNELPAARVTYTFTVNTVDGKPFEVRGRQYLVATDSDLWILSFSTAPGREREAAAEFEASAQSFQPE